MSGTTPRIHSYLIGFIFFIIVGLWSNVDASAVEIDDRSPKERILEILERIPQSSGHLHLGPIEINPSLKITGTFDDNIINAVSRDRRAHNDTYITYEPKISLTLPVRNHRFNFDYGYKILDYQGNYENHATEQDRVNRMWGGSVNFRFARGFSIKLSDRVTTITQPGSFTRRTNALIVDPTDVVEGDEGEEGEEEVLENISDAPLTSAFNTFSSRRTFTTNTANITINLPNFFDKLNFSISYTNVDSSYKQFSRRNQDRNKNILRGNVQIKPLPKINITTGFIYEHIRYDVQRGLDSRLNTIPLRITWRFTAKSHFFLESNYNWRNYGSGFNGRKFADFHGYKAVLGYRFNVTERDNLTIKFERSLVEQQFQSKNIAVLSQPTTIIPVGTRNNPQHWTQIGLDYIHQFSRNFSITFSPAWQRRRFRDRQAIFAQDSETNPPGTLINKHREIDSMRLEITGRYTAPRSWLFGEISYNYQHRDSNFPNGDLVKNVGTVSIGLSF